MVIVPEGKKLHWRLVRISFGVPERSLKILASVTKRSVFSARWSAILGGDDAQTVQSYLFISPPHHRSSGDEDAAENEGFAEITSFREPGLDALLETVDLSHARFLELLRESIHDIDQLKVISITELYYPADEATWRMKLLADPPELGRFQSELGAIALSGVKLRFSDSSVGLLEVSLDTSPAEDEYHCSLTSINHVPVDELPKLYEIILEQAEEFASLFIESREGS